jgi:hypothetical protein
MAAALGLWLLTGTACRRKEELRPVVPGTGSWEKTINIDPLKAKFTVRSPQKQFRDDGLWRGNLALHTGVLEAEFAPAPVRVIGAPSEGFLAEAVDRSGNTCLVVWGLSQGNQAMDSARRAMLQATAVVRLGMRDGLEQYFRQAGVNLQFRTMNDRELVKLVEAYSLHLMGCPVDRVTDLETRQMAELLAGQGLGRSPDASAPDPLKAPW